MKGIVKNLSLSLFFGIAVASMLLISTNDALSNRSTGSISRPQLPVLSLSGGEGYDRDWYPDGRIWIPRSQEQPREFLMPVFVNNRWFLYKTVANGVEVNTIPVETFQDIRSFQFKILYDSNQVRAVGVQTHGPRHTDDDLGYLPLASDFNITWHDTIDYRYWWYLRDEPGNPPQFQDYSRGRGLTISGSSMQKLPNTSLNSEEFKVLLYVRFQVVQGQDINSPIKDPIKAPVYISNDTIRYNGFNITADTLFKKERLYDTTGILDTEYQYPPVPPGNYFSNNRQDRIIGLSGMDTRQIDDNVISERVLPGVIYIQFMDTLPKFSMQISRGIGQAPHVRPSTQGEELWELLDPITVFENSAAPYPMQASRLMDIMNISQLTRLNDITIESDSKWLKFQTVGSPGRGKVIPLGRRGKVNWLDFNILGEGGLRDPLGRPTPGESNRLQLRIVADPNELDNDNPPSDDSDRDYNETTGKYIGYITFRSPNAAIPVVRLRVTFIYFRNPVEGFQANERGINLRVRNSAATPQSTRLVFGTGHRATVGVDSLFGEFGYRSPLQGFGARFYPIDDAGKELEADPENGYFGFGLGDFAPNDEGNDPTTPNILNSRSDSRDIRNVSDTLQSIIYKVKFDANGANNYPVVLTWDVRDFPEGAQLFIRDTENGQRFPSVNMRSSNLITGENYSYFFNDPEIKEFLIEYTLPRVINYVDGRGNPIIKRGWNLLSLPVRPLNTLFRTVYPNAQSQQAFTWFQAGYVAETNLTEGIGYFVRYSEIIDRQFAGTFISDISRARGNAPTVWPGDLDGRGGWNTIGGLSVPMSINAIDFDRFDANNLPSQAYTREHGVWGYSTNEGYREVSVIQPGLGYWIKTDARGYYKLQMGAGKASSVVDAYEAKEAIKANSTKITVNDNAQSSSTVYLSNNTDVNLNVFEMPPMPNYNLFDVRFISNTNLETANETMINLQGVEYPISINVADANANYIFTDAVTGFELGRVARNGSSSFVIDREISNVIKVTKESVQTGGDENYGLAIYPNPAGTETNFDYVTAENTWVTINVYNDLGALVATVVDEFKTAGEYNVRFNTSALTNGSYTVRVNAGANTSAHRLNVVR